MSEFLSQDDIDALLNGGKSGIVGRKKAVRITDILVDEVPGADDDEMEGVEDE